MAYVYHPKLKDVVNQYEDNDILHIGAKTGFFFVGTKKEYTRAIDDISRYYLEEAKSNLATRKAGMAALREAINELQSIVYDPTDRKLVERIGTLGSKIDAHARPAKESIVLIPRLEKYIDEFESLGERKVMEQRERELLHDGYIIIIDGDEVGKYWDKEEYDKDNKHNRRMSA